jgi:hypothetical protein
MDWEVLKNRLGLDINLFFPISEVVASSRDCGRDELFLYILPLYIDTSDVWHPLMRLGMRSRQISYAPQT